MTVFAGANKNTGKTYKNKEYHLVTAPEVLTVRKCWSIYIQIQDNEHIPLSSMGLSRKCKISTHKPCHSPPVSRREPAFHTAPLNCHDIGFISKSMSIFTDSPSLSFRSKSKSPPLSRKWLPKLSPWQSLGRNCYLAFELKIYRHI